MRNWEDIVKDKLEGYESPLPEGSLAEFRTRRDAVDPARKRHPLLWSMAAATAVAAGLSAALLLRHPTIPEDAIQVVQQPTAPVAMDLAPSDTIDTIPDIPDVAQAVIPKVIRQSTAFPQETLPVDIAESPETKDTTVSEPADRTPVDDIDSDRWTESPFIPQVPVKKRISLKVAPAAGLVTGGGLLASVITPIVKDGTYPVQPLSQPSNTNNQNQNGGGSAISSSVYPDYPNSLSVDGPPEDNPDEPMDVLSGEYSHYRPLKTGLSARVPISERWSLTTGLEYTLYLSRFTYSLSG